MTYKYSFVSPCLLSCSLLGLLFDQSKLLAVQGMDHLRDLHEGGQLLLPNYHGLKHPLESADCPSCKLLVGSVNLQSNNKKFVSYQIY